ncbi:tripartite tricarboxylate transporter TctB family protein [Leucobacter sp. wl10]|nr:tripartite tricarboxylate transporter TctB family protein [Leucobacter sp. wl10]
MTREAHPAQPAPKTTSVPIGEQSWWVGRSGLVFPLILAAFATHLLVGQLTMTVAPETEPPGPGFFSALIIGLLYLFAVLLAIGIIRRPQLPEDMHGDLRTSEIRVVRPGRVRRSAPLYSDWSRIAWAVGGFAAFILLLHPAGWILAGGLLFWTTARAFASPRPFKTRTPRDVQSSFWARAGLKRAAAPALPAVAAEPPIRCNLSPCAPSRRAAPQTRAPASWLRRRNRLSLAERIDRELGDPTGIEVHQRRPPHGFAVPAAQFELHESRARVGLAREPRGFGGPDLDPRQSALGQLHVAVPQQRAVSRVDQRFAAPPLIGHPLAGPIHLRVPARHAPRPAVVLILEAEADDRAAHRLGLAGERFEPVRRPADLRRNPAARVVLADRFRGVRDGGGARGERERRSEGDRAGEGLPGSSQRLLL